MQQGERQGHWPLALIFVVSQTVSPDAASPYMLVYRAKRLPTINPSQCCVPSIFSQAIDAENAKYMEMEAEYAKVSAALIVPFRSLTPPPPLQS